MKKPSHLNCHTQALSRRIQELVGENKVMEEITSPTEDGSCNQIGLAISYHHDRTMVRNSLSSRHGSSSCVNRNGFGGVCAHVWIPKRSQLKVLRGIRYLLTNEQLPLSILEKRTESSQWLLTLHRSLSEPSFLLLRTRARPNPIDGMPGRQRCVDCDIACSRWVIRGLGVVELPYLPLKLREHVTDSSDTKRPQPLERHLIRPFFHRLADSFDNKVSLPLLFFTSRAAARTSTREATSNGA